MVMIHCKDCGQEIINEPYIRMNYNSSGDVVDGELCQCMNCYSEEMDHYEYGCDGDGTCDSGCKYDEEIN
jgi:hypothetical protein